MIVINSIIALSFFWRGWARRFLLIKLLVGSDGVSRPVFASLGLKGFRSQSRSHRLQVSVTSLLPWDFDTAMIWFRKIYVIQRVFCLLYLQVGNNKSRWKKCQKFENFELRSGKVMTFFGKFLEKFWHNPHIFKSRVSISIFKSRSQFFPGRGLGLEVSVSTTSLFVGGIFKAPPQGMPLGKQCRDERTVKFFVPSPILIRKSWIRSSPDPQIF